ncbi:retrovirus-related pol polyprotein from transposon TNT 1-94 [Tanacetum coccineum]
MKLKILSMASSNKRRAQLVDWGFLDDGILGNRNQLHQNLNGVSSFFALNRALLLKWVWRFAIQDGRYGNNLVIRELMVLQVLFWSHCKKRIGNGDDSRFWFDCWIGDVPLRVKFPRLFALDLNKEASVAVKLSAPIDISFRRNARGGIERAITNLLADLTSLMDSVTLSNSGDRWVCDLVSDGNFRVKEIRNYIDDLFLPHQAAQTRWIKYIPIKEGKRNKVKGEAKDGSRGFDLYTIELQESSSPNTICFMAKASTSQAWLWHRRLSHLNCDTINLLSKKDIVKGLPKLKYVKDHLCSSCELGKAKRNTFKSKATPSSKRRLDLLHMDLYGPMRDEAPEVLINFLKMIQRGLQAQIRTVRTDRGTEFLNKTLQTYFQKEGIGHQTSTARTPEHNGVVERRNRTLVEAA